MSRQIREDYCDICQKLKADVRYADLLDKMICSDCMGVPVGADA